MTAVLLRVRAFSRIQAGHGRDAMEAVIGVVFGLPDLFGFALLVASGNELPTVAAFEIEGFDYDHAVNVANQVRHLIHGFYPWLRLADPVLSEVDEVHPANSEVYDLVPAAGPPNATVPQFASTWDIASRLPTRTEMRITVRSLRVEQSEPLSVRCAIEVRGSGANAGLVAAALTGEVCGASRYSARLRRAWMGPIEMQVPIEVAAWLLSVPSRLSSALATAALEDTAPPPTVLLAEWKNR